MNSTLTHTDTIINAAGRILPRTIPGYGPVRPYLGPFAVFPDMTKAAPVKLGYYQPGDTKLMGSLDEALQQAGLKNGMTLSFHHHLREGDYVVNQTLAAVQRLGVRDVTLAPSALFNVHKPLVEMIKDGTIRRIEGSLNGAIGRMVSEGGMQDIAILRSHGGRVRALYQDDLKVDIAIIAAPTSDAYGNCNGIFGKSACGPLAYAHADALLARKVIVVTDNLVPYPAAPISISQTNVDYVVVVESIGDPGQIVSGTLEIATEEPEVTIARHAARLMDLSGLLKNGCSIQAGAGGTSLATMKFVGEIMAKKGIRAAWANGGTTRQIIELFHQGLIEKVTTCQAFDQAAIDSLRDDRDHIETNIDLYANPFNKGCLCNLLDMMVLGATEVDIHFNVNVNTHSDGYLLHGIGGHQDTSAGAKLNIITVPLYRKNNPIILDSVTTVSTPGDCVDAIATEVGIAIHPRRQDLIDRVKGTDLPLFTIEQLRDMALEKAGRAYTRPKTLDRIVAVIEWRDGTVLDVVYQVDKQS